MPSLRSLLFVPGNRADMLDKALGFATDAYMPDMEDSVPDGQKKRARETIESHLPILTQAGPLVIPRVNSIQTGLMNDDLASVVGPYIYGVSVGKVNSPNDVQQIAGILNSLEARAGIEQGLTKLIVWIESALAIVNAYNICVASQRVVAAAFGAEDLTNDMAIERTVKGSEITYARNAISIAAKAAGILALDTPYFGLNDADGLKQDTAAARGCGFDGKFAIHPEQLEIINKAFGPSAAEVNNAKAVVAAFEKAERVGKGAISLDHKVIDAPVVKRARKLLKLARSRRKGV